MGGTYRGSGSGEASEDGDHERSPWSWTRRDQERIRRLDVSRGHVPRHHLGEPAVDDGVVRTGEDRAGPDDEVVGLGRIWRLTHASAKRDTTQSRMYAETSAQLVRHLRHAIRAAGARGLDGDAVGVGRRVLAAGAASAACSLSDPRGYRVQVSLDGATWSEQSPRASGEGRRRPSCCGSRCGRGSFGSRRRVQKRMHLPGGCSSCSCMR